MGVEELNRMAPRVRRKYLEILRAIPPGRRMEIVAELGDAVREMAGEEVSVVTSQTEVFRRVLDALACLRIDYMVVGSFAASAYGERRSTHDLDMVIALKPEAVEPLAKLLGDEFYLDEESARAAIDRIDMFNAIHAESGLKIDFWMLKDDEFSKTQFQRRRASTAWGTTTYFESPEDTILSKLLWYRITPSERQLFDVKGVLAVRKHTLDYTYLFGWADRLKVRDLLDSLIDKE